jgi:hypothetical protein
MRASTRFGVRVAGGATAALLAVGGCSSTVSGSGTLAATAAPSTSAGRDFPSASAVPTDSRPPSGTNTGSSPASLPASSGGPAPSSAPAPKVCATQSDCKLVKSWDVGAGYLVAAFSAPSASSGVGAAVLMLARGQVPVYWHVLDGETPAELLCKVASTAGESLRNCVLVDYVGAHAATAYPLVVDGDRLDLGAPVGTDTPGLHAADLDHDLLVDAYGLNNNYKPDYASGHVQWQTWRRSADGATLKSTGCGPLATSAPEAPTAFFTGSCDFG